MVPLHWLLDRLAMELALSCPSKCPQDALLSTVSLDLTQLTDMRLGKTPPVHHQVKFLAYV